MPSQKTKTLTKFLKLNVRLLNKLSRVKYEFQPSQKKNLPRFHLNGSLG